MKRCPVCRVYKPAHEIVAVNSGLLRSRKWRLFSQFFLETVAAAGGKLETADQIPEKMTVWGGTPEDPVVAGQGHIAKFRVSALVVGSASLDPAWFVAMV
jgi:hypothetical protein